MQLLRSEAQSSLTQQWLIVQVTNQEDLQLAFMLAIDLRGEPHGWMMFDTGFVLLANKPELHNRYPFPSTPDAQDLCRQFWPKVVREDVVGVIAEVMIPRQADMGGIGGWSQLELLFWTDNPLCLVRFLDPSAE